VAPLPLSSLARGANFNSPLDERTTYGTRDLREQCLLIVVEPLHLRGGFGSEGQWRRNQGMWSSLVVEHCLRSPPPAPLRLFAALQEPRKGKGEKEFTTQRNNLPQTEIKRHRSLMGIAMEGKESAQSSTSGSYCT
jgi:hypothetical protein